MFRVSSAVRGPLVTSPRNIPTFLSLRRKAVADEHGAIESDLRSVARDAATLSPGYRRFAGRRGSAGASLPRVSNLASRGLLRRRHLLRDLRLPDHGDHLSADAVQDVQYCRFLC